MKLTEFLNDIGNPVAYYPELRKITGGVTATILLCQLIYWLGKEKAENQGWIYKTAEEIQAETGMTYFEQKTARALLKKNGLIEERYARLEHTMYFKVFTSVLDEKWASRTGHNDIPESDNITLGKDESSRSFNESENTPEITPEITAEEADNDSKILNYEAVVNGWVDIVGEINKTTDKQLKRLVRSWDTFTGELPVGSKDKQVSGSEAVLEAFNESVMSVSGRPNLRYVEAVLNGWKVRGFKVRPKRSAGKEPTPLQKAEGTKLTGGLSKEERLKAGKVKINATGGIT